MYKVRTFFGEYDVEVEYNKYAMTKGLAIELIDFEEGWPEPFTTLTVCIPGKKLEDNCAYVDTNNNPWAEDFISENGLGEFTGEYGYSGFCMYPLYRFNLNKEN